MKQTTTFAQIILLLSACCLGCSSTDKQAGPSLSPKEQYIADLGLLIDSIIEALEPVQDAASAQQAMKEIEKLESVAEEVGQKLEQLKQSLADDSEALSDLGIYVDNEIAKYGDKIAIIEAKAGRGPDESQYPELSRAVMKLAKTARRE